MQREPETRPPSAPTERPTGQVPIVPQRPLAVVAVGGHAFMKRGEPSTIENHHNNANDLSAVLMTLVERDYDIVVSHGNGPQVGRLMQMVDHARDIVPPVPLDALVADTEGRLGYILQQALLNQLRRRNIQRYVVTMICQVLVDKRDAAFDHPTKPVGRFMEKAEAETMRDSLGWQIVEDAGRGWRRVVPSPKPRRVVQREMIELTARQGHIVIAVGGGGIPIIKNAYDNYEGVEAVIDKDLTSSTLAASIGAELMVILTDVPQVYVNYNQPEQTPLSAVTVDDITRLIEKGQFPAGSMGPKVTAVCNFLKAGGRRALITSPNMLEAALEGHGGTHFVGAL